MCSVLHMYSGILFTYKKSEIIICDMSGTEDQNKPGMERWVLHGAHTGGVLESSSQGIEDVLVVTIGL